MAQVVLERVTKIFPGGVKAVDAVHPRQPPRQGQIDVTKVRRPAGHARVAAAKMETTSDVARQWVLAAMLKTLGIGDRSTAQ